MVSGRSCGSGSGAGGRALTERIGLRTEHSPQLAAESFNLPRGETKKPGGLEKSEIARFFLFASGCAIVPYAAVAALWRFSIPRVTKVRMAARASNPAAMR